MKRQRASQPTFMPRAYDSFHYQESPDLPLESMDQQSSVPLPPPQPKRPRVAASDSDEQHILSGHVQQQPSENPSVDQVRQQQPKMVSLRNLLTNKGLTLDSSVQSVPNPSLEEVQPPLSRQQNVLENPIVGQVQRKQSLQEYLLGSDSGAGAGSSGHNDSVVSLDISDFRMEQPSVPQPERSREVKPLFQGINIDNDDDQDSQDSQKTTVERGQRIGPEGPAVIPHGQEQQQQPQQLQSASVPNWMEDQSLDLHIDLKNGRTQRLDDSVFSQDGQRFNSSADSDILMHENFGGSADNKSESSLGQSHNFNFDDSSDDSMLDENEDGQKIRREVSILQDRHRGHSSDDEEAVAVAADQPLTEQMSRLQLKDIVGKQLTQLGQYSESLGALGRNRCTAESVSKLFPQEGKDRGKGTYGVVIAAAVMNQLAKVGSVAIKKQVYDKQRSGTIDMIRHEVSIMNALSDTNNPFVAMYFGGCGTRNMEEDVNKAAFFEFSELGETSLATLVATENVLNQPKVFLNIMKQIMYNICWLVQDFDIVHNDLYARNIVLIHAPENVDFAIRANGNNGQQYNFQLHVAKNEWLIKLIDFGRATSSKRFDILMNHQYVLDRFKQSSKTPFSIQKYFQDMRNIKFGGLKMETYHQITMYDIPTYARDVVSILTEFYMLKQKHPAIEAWTYESFRQLETMLLSDGAYQGWNSDPKHLYEFVEQLFSENFLQRFCIDYQSLNIVLE